jgi:hypothetical protein
MNKTVLRSLTDKNKLPQLLIFIFIFAFLFLLVYKPFESSEWFPSDKKGTVRYFMSLLTPILCGIVVLAVSRYVMYIYNTRKKLSYGRFLFWILIEIIVMALIYTAITKFLFHDPRSPFLLIRRSAFYIGMILLIPYSISFLYLSLQEKDGIIRNLKARHKRKERIDADTNLIHLSDDKGVRRLSVRIENLIYFEGADNYINVYYLIKGKVSKYMFRNSLQNIEEVFQDKGLVRCHRSYIVNIEKVVVLRKEKDGVFIELDQTDVPSIPVSKTYSEKLLKMFSAVEEE